MLTRILTTALLAGAAAGLLAALLQLWFVQPVLIHAEMYESGELVHFGGDAASHDRVEGEAHEHAAPHSHDSDASRAVLLVLFNVLTYAGFALVLVGLMSLAEGHGQQIGPRTGLLWGIAGFVAVMLAPGFSLAPEVPGVAAADVALRQVWWTATVVMAIGALWLVAFGSGLVAWGAAALLLIAPHVVGAPEPDVLIGPVPPEIGALFAARVFGVGLAGWALMGLFAGWLWAKDDRAEETTLTV